MPFAPKKLGMVEGALEVEVDLKGVGWADEGRKEKAEVAGNCGIGIGAFDFSASDEAPGGDATGKLKLELTFGAVDVGRAGFPVVKEAGTDGREGTFEAVPFDELGGLS